MSTIVEAEDAAILEVVPRASVASARSSGARFSAHSVASGSASKVELTRTLPTDLLRGVPLKEALSGFGRHWSAIGVTPEQHRLSVPVRRGGLDDFLSHDWRSGRFSKFFALCYVYNLHAAGWLSMLMAAVIATLLHPAVLAAPEFVVVYRVPLCSAICIGAFFLVLTMWQRLTSCPLGDRIVFLDKLCIDQDDEERKAAGILGLAAFLKHSRRLVILWSPRYFTRLWCVYEVATWLSLGKSTKTDALIFLPVSIVRFTLLALAGWGLTVAMARAVAKQDDVGHVADVFQQCAFTLVAVAVTAMIRKDLHDFMQVPQQVANFSVREANCFCCSHNHRHPETGQPMMCDRKLVYRSLTSFYGDCLETTEGADEDAMLNICLDRFDGHVRSRFSDVISQYIVAGRITIGYWNLVTLSLWPTWEQVLVLSEVGHSENVAILARAWNAALGLFLLGPLAKTVLIRTLQCCPGGKHWWLDVVTNAIITMLAYGYELAARLPGKYLATQEDHINIIGLAAWTAVVGTVAYVVFWRQVASESEACGARGHTDNHVPRAEEVGLADMTLIRPPKEEEMAEDMRSDLASI
eukprot:TRINITY_DN74504_c0_g1_i1.p1 TRINITY_DN74504_c0_g1~~TRINITY_DN74504_c0_g1_i1.p1  ORF type:complete len:581 (-),score=26.64 TRINITY_DN74504_c0_g1_i1:47-1789(-)